MFTHSHKNLFLHLWYKVKSFTSFGIRQVSNSSIIFINLRKSSIVELSYLEFIGKNIKVAVKY